MKDKLKILCIMPESIGGRLTSSSLFDGFKQSGHDICVFDTLKKNLSIEKILEKESFDIISSYDYTAVIYKLKYNIQIPAVNYFSDVVDDVHSGVYWKKYYPYLKNNDIFTFYWDKELYLQKKQEISNLFYMPHFVDTDVYKNLNIPAKYEIMFAGRLDTEYRLRTVLQLMKKFRYLNFAWFAHKKHYFDVLSRLSDHEEKELIKKNYRGFIDNEKDMAQQINRTKIVFNFNSQGISSLNYRTFQVMACESLLLSDDRKEAYELFSPNKDFLIYNSIQELESMIEFYLNNPEQRKKIATAQRQIIEKNHSAKNCTQQILEKVIN